jgi:hypothetical protein
LNATGLSLKTRRLRVVRISTIKQTVPVASRGFVLTAHSESSHLLLRSGTKTRPLNAVPEEWAGYAVVSGQATDQPSTVESRCVGRARSFPILAK